MKPFNKEEIQAFRAATTGTGERIHLNNAGASLPPDIVVNTMKHIGLYGFFNAVV